MVCGDVIGVILARGGDYRFTTESLSKRGMWSLRDVGRFNKNIPSSCIKPQKGGREEVRGSRDIEADHAAVCNMINDLQH